MHQKLAYVGHHSLNRLRCMLCPLFSLFSGQLETSFACHPSFIEPNDLSEVHEETCVVWCRAIVG